MELKPELGPRVTIERIRALFGNAGPVQGDIWEEQFDQCDDELRQLARTPWEDLFERSFWVYFHDLNYVDLQPAVFDYLFPACLVMAQERLITGHSWLTSGDSDFLRALASRNWTNPCTTEQIHGTYEILIDGFLDRLDQQRGFHDLVYEGDITAPIERYNWIGRFNSLGYILPSIEPLWLKWWSIDSPGQAIVALEYAWALAVPDDSEDELDTALPLYSGPHIEPDAGIYSQAWEATSLDFLASTLSYDYLVQKVGQGVATLQGMPEELTARAVLSQVERRRELVDLRVEELLNGLREAPSSRG